MFEGTNLLDIEGDDFVKFASHIVPVLWSNEKLKSHTFRDTVKHKDNDGRPGWSDPEDLEKLVLLKSEYNLIIFIFIPTLKFDYLTRSRDTYVSGHRQ